MLIINADDWGRNEAATDAMFDCYRAGRITATSLMVFMKDSARGAVLAKECGIDVGLHLNLSEEFSHPNCLLAVRNAQGRIRRFLKRSKYALLVYHPFLVRSFANVVQAQLQEFKRLIGHEPVRIDGHQHLHLCSNILFSKLLPKDIFVRRSFSFGPGEKNAFNRAYRAWVDRKVLRRHRSTDLFFNLPGPGPALRSILTAAEDQQIELMTHPERADERAFLLSDEFRQVVTGTSLGTFQDLRTGSSRLLAASSN